MDYEKLDRLTDLKERDIGHELVENHFQVNSLNNILKELKRSKINQKKKKLQVSMIKSGLINLAKEIKDMCEQERENEGPDEMLNIVENILEFNTQQEGQGLEFLMPNQMLSRLPISLAQLKAENNCEKFKNEIRQLFYSLYRSKKLTKQLYKSLVDII